jgi:MOSC domain-containing protein YiiM
MKIRKPGNKGFVAAVCRNEMRDERKFPVPMAELRRNYGIVGDGHAGEGGRQISLLARESIRMLRERGIEISAGDCAENITTEGIDLVAQPVGTLLRIGPALVEVTQHCDGCDEHAASGQRPGICAMPEQGVYARVLRDGTVRPGDTIMVASKAEAMKR